VVAEENWLLDLALELVDDDDEHDFHQQLKKQIKSS
jgi:hypothetical protein